MKTQPLTQVEYQEFYKQQGYNPNIVKAKVETENEVYYIMDKGQTDEEVEIEKKEIKAYIKSLSSIILLVLSLSSNNNCKYDAIEGKIKSYDAEDCYNQSGKRESCGNYKKEKLLLDVLTIAREKQRQDDKNTANTKANR